MHHVCVKVVLKTSFVTVMMVMLGVSCSSWIPAEGSVVAPFPPSLVHFSCCIRPKKWVSRSVVQSAGKEKEPTSVRMEDHQCRVSML